MREVMAEPSSGGGLGRTRLSLSLAQEFIRGWGNVIRDAFTASNAHLTVPRGCGGGNMGDAVAALQRQIAALQRSAQIASEQASLSATESKAGVATVIQLLQGMSIAPAHSAGESSHSGGAAVRSHHAAGPRAGLAAAAAVPRSSPMKNVGSFLPSALSSPSGAMPAPHPPLTVARSPDAVSAHTTDESPSALPAAGFGSLSNLRDVGVARTLAGKNAIDIALEGISRLRGGGGVMASADASRVRDIIAVFRAMATPSELSALEPAKTLATGAAVNDGVNREEGERRAILSKLD